MLVKADFGPDVHGYKAVQYIHTDTCLRGRRVGGNDKLLETGIEALLVAGLNKSSRRAKGRNGI